MYTDEQLQHAVAALKNLQQEQPETEEETYTVDEVVDSIIGYFEQCLELRRLSVSESTVKAYERAMGIVKK